MFHFHLIYQFHLDVIDFIHIGSIVINSIRLQYVAVNLFFFFCETFGRSTEPKWLQIHNLSFKCDQQNEIQEKQVTISCHCSPVNNMFSLLTPFVDWHFRFFFSIWFVPYENNNKKIIINQKRIHWRTECLTNCIWYWMNWQTQTIFNSHRNLLLLLSVTFQCTLLIRLRSCD